MIAKITLPSGIAISVRIEGREESPWLVLSNSVTATFKMWDPQIEMLTKAYRVLRYDTRGHGESDAPAAPYSLDDLVADAVGLMDHFEMKDPTFMGLSLGGMTGLGIALLHPKRLRALVCCDARADAPAPFVQGWDDRIKAVRERGYDAIAANTVERWLAAPFRKHHPERVAELEEMVRSTSLAGFEGCAAALKKLDYFGNLDRIEVPTLFVCGSEDLGAPPAVMRSMANRVRNARLEIVDGSAHLPNIDNPEGFARAISGFLELE